MSRTNWNFATQGLAEALTGYPECARVPKRTWVRCPQEQSLRRVAEWSYGDRFGFASDGSGHANFRADFEGGGELREALLQTSRCEVQGCIGDPSRGINDDHDFLGSFRDHAARGIADWTAEWACGIGQDRPTLQMPGLLADAFVFFAGGAVAQRYRRIYFLAIVAAVGPAGLERAEVADVHNIRHAIKALALHHAPQQRFRRRAIFRWVHAPFAKHGAHRANRPRFGETFHRKFGALAGANFVHQFGEVGMDQDDARAIRCDDTELHAGQCDLNFHAVHSLLAAMMTRDQEIQGNSNGKWAGTR